MSKTVASLVVFSLSAIMHEVLVSVPFHIIRPWSFLGMICQVPLVRLKPQICLTLTAHRLSSLSSNFLGWIDKIHLSNLSRLIHGQCKCCCAKPVANLVAEMPYHISHNCQFIFWISFCLVGQPMAVLLYTIDYQYQKRVLEGSDT